MRVDTPLDDSKKLDTSNERSSLNREADSPERCVLDEISGTPIDAIDAIDPVIELPDQKNVRKS